MDKFTMSPRQRIDAVRGTLAALTRLQRHAALLLLNFDEGKWFAQEDFVRHALLDGAAPGEVTVAFDQLERLLERQLRRGGWVDELGPVAFGVLWLACQLAGGELADLAAQADPDARRLITQTVGSAFSGGDSPGPEQAFVQRV